MQPEQLIEKISTYIDEKDLELVKKGIELCRKAHTGQYRESGEDYFYHPVSVACIIADLKLDAASIITALLHDTVEDNCLKPEDIKKEFGEEITKLVDGITKLNKIENQPVYIRQAESFRKLLLAMSADIRVLLVKLADRLHNMRTIDGVKSIEKRKRVARETMEVYVPLAERIGIDKIKIELQDIAFNELYPEARTSILSRLEYLRKGGGSDVISRIEHHIINTLEHNGLKPIKVNGREKTPCSIWKKMEKKNVSFEQLSDIMAFRIIVSSISDCYQALGIIHSAYHMIPDSFKDFISTPKDNGYRSIHTIVMGPEQQRIEVQIRTENMHEIAELGVAAHWSYKQNASFNAVNGMEFRWIRELIDILEHTPDPEDVLENTKLEMYHDQVFCFTPKGNLISLPKGATPVDFAYGVHSDVGRTCVGSKVNGKIVPLKTALNNGDQVEIIRSKNASPSPAWEKFVVTPKARSDIKRFVRLQQRQEYINLGRALLSKTVKNAEHDYADKILDPILDLFKKKSTEDLLASVGEGAVSRQDVLNALFPEDKKARVANERKSLTSIFNFGKKEKASKKPDLVLPIKGLIPGMAMHFAGCCHPLPGDRIVGIVHTGKGVTIHVSDCEMLENFSSTPERWIDVSWGKESGSSAYIGRIKVLMSHDKDSFATLTSTIAKDFGNITNLKIVNRTLDYFEVIIDIEVKGARHLTNIIASLRTKSCIHSIDRFKN